MKFCIETYGCTSNLGNSLELRRALESRGHTSSDQETADIIIVNTCAVTEHTERRMIRRLNQIDGLRLIIAGCLPAAIPGAALKIKARLIKGILSAGSIREIVELLDHPSDRRVANRGFSYMAAKGRPQAGSHLNVRGLPLIDGTACGIVNISEGCPGECTYCIVRKARGDLISRDPGEIVNRAKSLIRAGAIEIQLACQDGASWGSDIGTSLPELLDMLSRLDSRCMIRVGMMNPDTVIPIMDELIDSMRSPRIYSFIHLPLQSGSARVLRAMGRRYTPEDFLRIVNRYREEVPQISLTTDVIAGFPGETEDEFEETLRLVRLCRPDKVNVTRYSSRPGTDASSLYDMPDRFKKARSRSLTALWMEIAAERMCIYEGTRLNVLVTERGRGRSMKGRTSSYIGVVIDGVPDLGKSYPVRITGSTPFYLRGVMDKGD